MSEKNYSNLLKKHQKKKPQVEFEGFIQMIFKQGVEVLLKTEINE
jgi:hypothetical protein